MCEIFSRINHTCLQVTYTFVQISYKWLTVYITHFIQWTISKHWCHYLCPQQQQQQQQQFSLINFANNESSPSTLSSRVIVVVTFSTCRYAIYSKGSQELNTNSFNRRETDINFLGKNNIRIFLACRSRQASIVLERYFRFEMSLLSVLCMLIARTEMETSRVSGEFEIIT